MSQTQKARNATQRIEDLERAVMAMYHTADSMARDILTIKEAIKLLGNKLDVVAKAASVSEEQISAGMIANNVAELKEKVDNMIAQNVLVLTETAEEKSFVVGRELADDGSVANPRIQFVVSTLAEELRSKIVGSKAGDVLNLQDGKLKLEVLEVYSVNNPEDETVESSEQSEQISEEATAAAE